MSIGNWKEINWRDANSSLRKKQSVLREALINKQPWPIIKKIHNDILTGFDARALAVRKVTSSKGGKTPGVDNKLLKTDSQKFEAEQRAMKEEAKKND